jgi:5'-deoxynucleotidase YfbR-like HD superfamily hydrolase
MQIDKELLKEEKYTNPRVVVLKNPEIKKLWKEIVKAREVLLKDIDKAQALETQIKSKQSEIEKIQTKLIPYVREELKDELGELEDLAGIDLQDGKMVAKVYDAIEEWVKARREQNKKRQAEQENTKKAQEIVKKLKK